MGRSWEELLEKLRFLSFMYAAARMRVTEEKDVKGEKKLEIIQTPYMLDEKQKHVQKLTSFEKTTIVNIQLQKEEMIPEHEAAADVIIIVKSGTVSFMVEGETVQLSSGNMLHMKPFEKHSLKADEACDLIVMQIKP